MIVSKEYKYRRLKGGKYVTQRDNALIILHYISVYAESAGRNDLFTIVGIIFRINLRDSQSSFEKSCVTCKYSSNIVFYV